jgi:uncharacterized membrane protein
MHAMTRREVRMVDGQLIGHAINSASFFGSASLILIAAVAGALFGGKGMLPDVSGLGVQVSAERLEIKLALVIICLARGLLEFIWSIRQQNYCLALIGAAPEGDGPKARAYAEAAAEVMNPALTAFSRGVRGYYFALAAAAWIYGAAWLAAAAIAATALLIWRQSRSPAAQGIRKARAILEDETLERSRKRTSRGKASQ